MATIDAAVAQVVDSRNPHTAPDDDDDDLIDALERDADDEPVMAAFRERRRAQLAAELAVSKEARATGGGALATINDEKEVLDLTTTTEHVVVHFFKTDFGRCQAMDRRLETLAALHYEARFVRTDVEQIPFLVERLKIRILPCVVAFKGGIAQDRIVGFDGVARAGSANLDVDARKLEARLLGAGVLARAKVAESEGQGVSARRGAAKEDDEDYDDWE